MIKDGVTYSDEFNGQCYLDRYPDVAEDGKYNTPEKALIHWLQFGQFENRIPGCVVIDPGGDDNDIPDTGDGTPPANNNKQILIIVAIVAAILLAKKYKVI